MKRVSFAVRVVLMPLLMVWFSYIFLDVLGMRPVGVAITYLLRNLICLVLVAAVLCCRIDQQIWTAIHRFDEAKNDTRANSQDKFETKAINECQIE